jgi:hypothetical protein
MIGSIKSDAFVALVIVTLVFLAPGAASADDTRQLFNGKDFTGWQNASGNAPGAGWVVEDGAMVRKERAGDIWTKERFGNFVLEVEFKTQGNSGIFFRTDNPRDCVQTGIEVQVNNPSHPGKHSVGCFYDLVAPTKDVAKKDDWNKVVITAKDNLLSVELNGEKITEMDLDQWTEPGKNPDGSRNKFRTALKDFKREGHVGFQDHGAQVAYRNVRIRVLD